MEELKSPDRRIAVHRANQPAHHRVLGVKPVPHLVRVVVPAVDRAFERLPFLPADDPLPVGAVDASLVEVRPVEQPAKLPRQHDVGVEMENPIASADLVECPIDQPRLIKRSAAAMVFG